MTTDRIANLRKDDFYGPILVHLSQLGGSASVEELNAPIIAEFNFTDEEQSATYPKSGDLIIPDKIGWGRSRLKMAGLLASGGSGVWVLTDAGREALAKGEDAIRREVQTAERAYNKEYQAKRKAMIQAPARNDEQYDNDEPSQEWSDVLLSKLRTIDPTAFERLSQRLLRESGFTSVKVTGKSGDGGIDGQGVLRMNLISFQVLFQCKRYAGSVSAGAVRDFRGAMQGRADKGLIITTGTFTPDARREATRDGAPAIDLIDGETLAGLLKKLGLGVKTEQVISERVTVEPAFFEEI